MAACSVLYILDKAVVGMRGSVVVVVTVVYLNSKRVGGCGNPIYEKCNGSQRVVFVYVGVGEQESVQI